MIVFGFVVLIVVMLSLSWKFGWCYGIYMIFLLNVFVVSFLLFFVVVKVMFEFGCRWLMWVVFISLCIVVLMFGVVLFVLCR